MSMKVTVYITVDLLYGFYTLLNLLKNSLSSSTDLGAYEINTEGHSVRPLVLTLFIDR